jgi:hypothetical protein
MAHSFTLSGSEPQGRVAQHFRLRDALRGALDPLERDAAAAPCAVQGCVGGVDPAGGRPVEFDAPEVDPVAGRLWGSSPRPADQYTARVASWENAVCPPAKSVACSLVQRSCDFSVSRAGTGA